MCNRGYLLECILNLKTNNKDHTDFVVFSVCRKKAKTYGLVVAFECSESCNSLSLLHAYVNALYLSLYTLVYVNALREFISFIFFT